VCDRSDTGELARSRCGPRKSALFEALLDYSITVTSLSVAVALVIGLQVDYLVVTLSAPPGRSRWCAGMCGG
jgi:hypothetical protein